MKIQRSLKWGIGVFLVLGSLFLSSCGETSAPGSQAAPASTATAATYGSSGASNHTVIIPNNDMFTPYIAQLNVGDTVTWVNADTVLHTILTTPSKEGNAINPEQFQYVLGPGKSASFTPRQPGLYYYYCDAHASLPDGGAALARKGVRPYPIPMDGFLYVRGTGISAAANQTVTMDADNRFAPWLTIVNVGGSVSWKNQTQQAIRVQGTPGYGLLNPTPLDFQVAPGSTSTTTFQTVGVYDYYSPGSAKLAPVWLRPEAIAGKAGYPAPMEGIVAVFP